MKLIIMYLWLWASVGVSQICTEAQRGGYKSLKTLLEQDEAVKAVEAVDSRGELGPQNCSCEIGGDSYKLGNFSVFLKYDPSQHVAAGQGNGFNISQGRLLVDFRFDYEATHLGKQARGVGEG